MKQKVLNFAMVLLFLAALGYCIAYSLHFKEIAQQTFDMTHNVIYAWVTRPILLFTLGFLIFRLLTIYMVPTKPLRIFKVLPILGFALMAAHLVLGALWYWAKFSLPYEYYYIFNFPWLFFFLGMCFALSE